MPFIVSKNLMSQVSLFVNIFIQKQSAPVIMIAAHYRITLVIAKYATCRAKKILMRKRSLKYGGGFTETVERIQRAFGVGTFSRKFAGVISNQIY